MSRRPNRLAGRLALVAATLLVAGTLAAGAGAAVVLLGLYDIAADRPHTQPVYSLLELAMQRSVRRQARAIEEPPLELEPRLERGALCYRVHCEQCHGAPGVAPQPIGLAAQPLPGPLVDAAQHWRPRELYWITRHGIRMSGMPAWGQRLADDDLWALVAYVALWLPRLSPADHTALHARLPSGDGCDSDTPVRRSAATVTPTRAADAGRQLLQRHACNGCHVIPGVVGSARHVGPPLAAYARRSAILGRWPNDAEHLARWIREPQHLKPGSAMPSLGIDAADAHAMAAYLLSLH